VAKKSPAAYLAGSSVVPTFYRSFGRAAVKPSFFGNAGGSGSRSPAGLAAVAARSGGVDPVQLIQQRG
jgi:hypothetical protein